jgi:hypothetical protein
MNTFLLLALTKPNVGREAEFNHWYDTIAYPTYKSIPGLIPLGRFKAVDVPHMFPFERSNEYQYLSLYMFKTDDVAAFMTSVKECFNRRPEYSFSPDIDQSCFFEPIFVSLGDANFAPLDDYRALKY